MGSLVPLVVEVQYCDCATLQNQCTDSIKPEFFVILRILREGHLLYLNPIPWLIERSRGCGLVLLFLTLNLSAQHMRLC